MAVNPMQRKARNSFLLGMLLMLVISGVVIAILTMQLMAKIKEENAQKSLMAKVCVLNTDVKSGEEITSDMLETKEVYKSLIPSDATSNVGDIDSKIAKVDLKKNTVVTQDLLVENESEINDDIRKQEYNIVILPADLETGEFIDVRIMFPNGQDFIVVSRKQVEIPSVGGTDSVDTIWVNLSEDEILHMSCAIVEAAKIPGTKIYANKYTDPGIQKAATPTYVINNEAYEALRSNPNIVDLAKNQLSNRYQNGNQYTVREQINQQANEIGVDPQTKIDESITNSKTERRNYIESLSPAATN